jgi:NAD(P)-dependent dehydrogenase (short-subunit alcohol dehydrogenase family)
VVADPLIFLSGASSGIGLAMVRTLPFERARVIGISRRAGDGSEHFAADLADPASWPVVGALFEREIADFAGERVIFVHGAGTLDPIGFAGEVDDAGYARQVLLNAAAPQVLGHAFLRAAAKTQAACRLLFISSGAGHSPYEGWSAYCGGKAAVDHWVRTVGLEQQRRGGRCKVLAVAPGVVETPMQAGIRGMSEEAFPDVERFRALQREGALRRPEEAARDLWSLLEADTSPNGSVLDLRES